MENKLYNLDILKVTTADDDEFLIKILSTFLTNNKEMIIKLNKAFENKQYTEMGEISHKMLGSYKHLEVNTIIPALSELEKLIQGKNIKEDHIKELTSFISTESEKVFFGIEKEISEINKN